jgi:hypothetical protein
MQKSANKLYALRKNIFSVDYLNELKLKILSSAHLASSPLGKEFVDTDGFSLVFRRTCLNQVINDFPFFKTYLEKVLIDNCNAFYLNPLVLYRGSRVDSHIDCRLLSKENMRIIPNLVTVLYIQVDDHLKGGEFVLKIDEDEEVSIKPQTNALLYFKGSLIHSVNEVKENHHPRISLVCEQYNLEANLLETFPSFRLVPGNRPMYSSAITN